MIDFKSLTKKSVIYKLTCLENNKIYIGECLNLYIRFNHDYMRELIREKRPIINAINCYGWEKFEIEILHEFDEITKEELLWIEANYIECFESTNREIGYNVCPYAISNAGRIYSKEEKAILYSTRMGENHHLFGKHHTDETKRKQSEIRIGKYCGENSSRFGKTNSLETIQKFRNTWEEKIENGYISPLLGKKCSEEHIEKNRLAHIGKIPSEETRKKIGEAGKKWDHSFCKRPVKQINKNTDEVIKIWPSATDAKNALGLKSTSNIQMVCNKRIDRDGFQAKTAYGFKWEYVENQISPEISKTL